MREEFHKILSELKNKKAQEVNIIYLYLKLWI